MAEQCLEINLDDQQMLLDIDCMSMIRKVRELQERVKLLEMRLTILEEKIKDADYRRQR